MQAIESKSKAECASIIHGLAQSGDLRIARIDFGQSYYFVSHKGMMQLRNIGAYEEMPRTEQAVKSIVAGLDLGNTPHFVSHDPMCTAAGPYDFVQAVRDVIQEIPRLSVQRAFN